MRIKTLLTAARFAKQGESLATVALPHTWNALDGQDGGADYWRGIVSHSKNAEIVEIGELESNEEVWNEWLNQNRGYAISDRKSMEAGAGKYLNFVKIVLKKKTAR